MDGEIEPETLREAMADGPSPLILDIRSADAYARGHLPGSENVPFPELPQRIEDVADADHVVTVCPHGQASVKAARIVSAYQDFDGEVLSLAGGLEAWDGPLETDEQPADDAPDAPF
jgi:rhodanese-related sulfurtransferase